MVSPSAFKQVSFCLSHIFHILIIVLYQSLKMKNRRMLENMRAYDKNNTYTVDDDHK